MVAVCKFCGFQRELRNSHIFPEFLYKPLYDATYHRAWELSTDADRPRFIYKGIREPLLCANCETHFDRSFEDYFARFWYTGRLPNPAHGARFELRGYDYSRFKLFGAQASPPDVLSSAQP